MADDVIFADGLAFFEPHPNAPDFIKGCISINPEKLAAWMAAQKVNENGYIKLDVKEARSGKLYVSLNTYKPTGGQREERAAPAPTRAPECISADIDNFGDDIPF